MALAGLLLLLLVAFRIRKPRTRMTPIEVIEKDVKTDARREVATHAEQVAATQSDVPTKPASEAPAQPPPANSGLVYGVAPTPKKTKPRSQKDVLDPELHGLYGQAGALQYVSGLSDDVLDRVLVFFELLDTQEAVESLTLADALGVQPRELPGLLITPLRRRADAIDAPPPYEIGRSAETGHREWRDSGRVARNILDATRTIQDARVSTRRTADASSAHA